MSTYPNDSYLAQVRWLHDHAYDENICILDARYDVQTRADGSYKEVSGSDAFLKGHIPTAQFVDLKADLTDQNNPMSIIDADAFSALMSRLGVDADTTVIVYDDRGGLWAARLWWALRYYGHKAVKILNGGLGAWRGAGYALETKSVALAPSSFIATPQTRLRAEKHDVLAAIDEDNICIIDALPKPFYQGRAGLYPRHRKGHIPRAVNIPAEHNLDPKTGCVKPVKDLEALWGKAVNAKPQPTFITYCGGGVFASFALFILALLGYEEAALYDASWMEWGADSALPVETGRGVSAPK